MRMAPERYVIPERIKAVGPVINDGALFAFLASAVSEHAPLASRLYRGLKSVPAFRAEFGVQHSQGVAHRKARSKLPARIFEQAKDAGILVPLARRYVPRFCAPLKAVADRKAAGVGRLIYPACKVNDACRRPDRCPLPFLPDMIHGVLGYRFGWTCDIRSWFYSFTLGVSVASEYFCTHDGGGRPYAHVRGPMGFSHMPTLATCVAQAMVDEVLQGVRGCGYAWIDDITVVAETKTAAEEAQRKFIALAAALSVELRDMTPVSQHIAAVGIEFDLAGSKWRLQESWCKKAVAAWVPSGRMLARDFMQQAGRAAWAAYALQLPMLPFRVALKRAGQVVDSLLSGDLHGESPVAVSVAVQEELSACRSLLQQNPWRCERRGPTRIVVTDASEGGIGMLFSEGGRCVELAVPAGDVTAEHSEEAIAVKEAVAMRIAVCRDSHVGKVVTCVTDNSALFWVLRTLRSPRSDGMARELRRMFAWCFERGTTLLPLWLSTEKMSSGGADAASRSPTPYRRSVSAMRLAECVREAELDTMRMFGQWHQTERRGVWSLPQPLCRVLFAG